MSVFYTVLYCRTEFTLLHNHVSNPGKKKQISTPSSFKIFLQTR